MGLFVSFFFINLALEKFGYETIEGIYIPIPSCKSGVFIPVENDTIDKKTIQKVADNILREEISKEIKTWDNNPIKAQ